MNFLAHLQLAGDDEGLRLGALLGDFTKGPRALRKFPEPVRTGIKLHRHIDTTIDAHESVAALRQQIPKPFRRYAGIIIDLALDHELANRWSEYSEISLEAFDIEVREMLARNDALVPKKLVKFMQYADRRGLFAAYRNEEQILRSISGIGRRFLRPNPLHQVSEIWGDLKPAFAGCFDSAYPAIQSDVADWLSSRSTTTGS